MYYPEDVIRQVRERTDIVGLVSGYVPLQKKGSQFFGRCPFHNEKTPSFSVNPKEQFFYCFGCHKGGNAITFLMEMDNLTFPEALKELADRSGIQLPEAELSEEEKRRLAMRDRLYEVNREAARYFYYQLTRTPQGERAREYLKERGVSEEYMRKFGLGYSAIGKNSLYQYLSGKGFTMQEMQDARLISVRNGKVYDYFFNRLMFPIFNVSGQTIAFGGRVMGQGEPKYLNSPETEVFNKRRNLYAMQLARKSRRKEALMVEGYMDVLSLHQAGFDNAVASLGTALTQEQALLIKRYYNDIVLIYDSDRAGTNAARRAIPILQAAGLKVRVLRVPGAKDPDEYLKKNSPEDFQKLIDEKAMDPIEFEQVVLEEQNGSGTVEARLETVRGVEERLAEIENDIERQLQIESAAARLKVDAGALRKDVDTIRRTTGILERRSAGGENAGRPAEASVRFDARAQLIGLLLKNQPLLKRLRENTGPAHLDAEMFLGPDRKEDLWYTAAKTLFACSEKNETLKAADLVSAFSEASEQQQIARLFQEPVPDDPKEAEKLLTDNIRTLKLNCLDEKMKILNEQGLSSREDLQAMQDMIYEKRNLQHLQVKIS